LFYNFLATISDGGGVRRSELASIRHRHTPVSEEASVSRLPQMSQYGLVSMVAFTTFASPSEYFYSIGFVFLASTEH
jgi:hypothetical protein